MLYFASAKDATGLTTENFTFPEEATLLSISELFQLLESRHPKLKEKKVLSSVNVAVNLEYVELVEGKIKPGDEVAIIPPVSGG